MRIALFVATNCTVRAGQGFVTRSKDERVVQRKISLGEDGIRRVALEYDERVFLGLLVSLR